eukprot:3532273-Heterocapsa_arctica.AAC.1
MNLTVLRRVTLLNCRVNNLADFDFMVKRAQRSKVTPIHTECESPLGGKGALLGTRNLFILWKLVDLLVRFRIDV